jgi:hypothetical protein
MPKTIRMIADEVRNALELPAGYYVKVDDADNILVGNDDLAFAITRKQIDDGLAVTTACAAFPGLLAAVAKYRTRVEAGYPEKSGSESR